MLLLLVYTSGECSFERLTAGAEPLGLNNSITAFPYSEYPVYYNPANLVYHQTSKITLNYRTFYGISDLRQADVSGIHPVGPIHIGWGVHYYGNKLYRETQILLAGSRQINESISLGLGVSLFYLSVSGYGQASTLGINLSVSTKISDKLYSGAMFCNLNQPTLGHYEEPLPQSFDMGLCYLPDDDLFFTIDFNKESRFKPDIRCGAGYRPFSAIILRVGIEDRIESFSMGFGLKLTKFRFDYAVIVHPVLDPSHIISVLVEL